jgi:hypothetical protein
VPARGSIIQGVQSETFLSGKFVAAPPSVDEVVAAFARVQHGLVTLLQLLEAGLTESAISKRVARGALHRVHRTVYSVGHIALSREARFLAAVLASGPGALLSHLSAAELWQISRFRAHLIAVVAPRKREVKGVRVHAARHLHRRDATSRNRIPVTSTPRLFVDLTDVLTAYQLANVIHEAAFRGHFSELATRDAIERANGRHNLHVLEKALRLNAAGSAGTKSGHEDAFLALLDSIGFPEPRVNTDLHGFEVDFHWPQRKLAVEVDGVGHGRPRTLRDDAHEDRTLRAAGYTVLRFTGDDLQRRPAEVLRSLGRAA